MLKIDKKIFEQLDILLLKIVNSLEDDIIKLHGKQDKYSFTQKKSLVGIICQITNLLTKANQCANEQQITNYLTIEDTRVINNYLKKISSEKQPLAEALTGSTSEFK